MPLSIRIISSPDGENITEWNKQFPESGGDIGRAFGSTLQLSDASRELSNCHATIKKSNRGYHIIDNSSNGLFVNGSSTPLGKGNQSPLNDGDVLDLGRFRLLVSCFIPSAPALLSQPAGEVQGDVFDDPFSSADVVENVETTNDAATEEVDFTISDYAVVEEDPFGGQPSKKQQATPQTHNDFRELDDDPFSQFDMNPVFPSSPMGSTPTSEEEINSPVALNRQNQVNVDTRIEDDPFFGPTPYEPDIDQAIEMALNRLLQELAPENLESMFDELSTPGMFRRQPKYWELYKRYFKRQMNSRDLQVKFQAYFKDSIKVQQKLEGK